MPSSSALVIGGAAALALLGGVAAATEHGLPPVTAPTQAHRTLMPRALALLCDEAPCALFYDMDMLRERLLAIKHAFPSTTVHAVAVKANALAGCLSVAKELGMGCEVASAGELEHALRRSYTVPVELDVRGLKVLRPWPHVARRLRLLGWGWRP